MKTGWGGRDRTCECRHQKPVPYRLATPQLGFLMLPNRQYGRSYNASKHERNRPIPAFYSRLLIADTPINPVKADRRAAAIALAKPRCRPHKANMHGTLPQKKSLGEGELMVMMASIMALGAFGTDAMLPAFPAMISGLAIHPENSVQQIITVYLLGTGIGSLFYGPLSDRYGRKRVLILAILAYVACSLACSYAVSFAFLLAARFANGLFAAAMGVLATAIVRDRFSGDAMAKRMSLIFLIFMIVPIIAPSIGQLVLYVAQWRTIFDVMAGLAVCVLLWIIFRLPETLDPAHVILIRPSKIVATWRAVIFNRTAAGYIAANGIVQGAIFGFLTSAQPIIDKVFDLRAYFGLCFAAISVGVASSNLANARIVERFGARRVSHSAVIVFILIALLQLLAAKFVPQSLPLFLGLLTANMSMLGFMGSNFGSIAMQPFGAMAGAASSFQNFVRVIIAAAIGASIGQSFNGSAVPMALGYLGCGICALAMVSWGERGKLFTRPGTTKLVPM
jgi:MFS transporter, DHA1 family, multidrug resistance protein